MQQHAGEVVVGELKVPLVVEFEQGRTVRMIVFQVQVVHFRLVRRVTALLANVNLRRNKSVRRAV